MNTCFERLNVLKKIVCEESGREARRAVRKESVMLRLFAIDVELWINSLRQMEAKRKMSELILS